MKRSAPLQRRTPLKSTGELKRTPLKPRSKKTAEVYRKERVPLTKEMLAENPYCEMRDRIRSVQPDYSDCWRLSIGLHEIVKRSAGGSITDRDNVLRCCGPCNSFVEDHPVLARKAGLVRRRGETEW